MDRLDRLTHRVVHPATLPGAQFVIKRDSHQGMGELIQARICFFNDMSAAARRTPQEPFPRSGPAGAHQDIEGEIPADHRRDRQDLVARRR